MGTATVSGSGSKWNATNLSIGGYGTGSVTIANGAIASDVTTFVGVYSGGSGTLNILNGSTLNSSGGGYLGSYLGSNSNANGTVNVDGGSSWNMGANVTTLNVGSLNDTCTLNITNGSTVTIPNGRHRL